MSVTVARGEAAHRLVIADEGRGLGDELKAQALERFWRLDHAKPGTGLGLPIARALAEASGGSLVLADAPSGGLAVTVNLPAARPAQHAGGWRVRPREEHRHDPARRG